MVQVEVREAFWKRGQALLQIDTNCQLGRRILARSGALKSYRIGTKVRLSAENKAIFLRGIEPKVTTRFGPASAIIMPTASSVTQTSNEDKIRGEKRNAETTEGFLTN